VAGLAKVSVAMMSPGIADSSEYEGPSN
jgi:hypothetical protein